MFETCLHHVCTHVNTMLENMFIQYFRTCLHNTRRYICSMWRDMYETSLNNILKHITPCWKKYLHNVGRHDCIMFKDLFTYVSIIFENMHTHCMNALYTIWRLVSLMFEGMLSYVWRNVSSIFTRHVHTCWRTCLKKIEDIFTWTHFHPNIFKLVYIVENGWKLQDVLFQNISKLE